MKTAKRTILIVLLILLIAIVSLGIWQRENIKSFINSIKYTEDEISNMMEENNKKMDDIVEKTDYIDVRKGGLTAEEQAAVAGGEITSEEAVEIVRGKTTLEEIREKKKQESEKLQQETQEKPTETTQEATQPKPPKEPETVPEKEPEKQPEKQPEETPQDEMTDEVSNIVAELYVTKADFISRLEEIGEQMYYEYTKITRYDRTQIDSIINKNLPTVATLERECDTKINKLLTDLEAALKKGGGDLGLVDEIRQYYYQEKSLKKSYYFEQIKIGTSD